MSATSMFKIGFLSMIAATGLFAASNGFAADAREATVATVAVSDDFKIQVTPGGRWQVVDSKGNIHLLTEHKDGKVSVPYEHPYTMPMSH